MHLPRNVKERIEFRSPIYVWRYLCFFAMSFCRVPIKVRLWGSPYCLRANRETLGINGYLYIFRQDYEPEVRDALKRYFADGWLFLDIGANSGYWSRFIATQYKRSRIIAFEPAAETFALLCENVREFGSRVQTENFAVSDEMKTAYLAQMSDPGGRHLISGPSNGAERVAVVTIDHEAKQGGWLDLGPNRCLLKVDVEGHEYRALAGARNFISMNRPIVVFEMMEENLSRANRSSDEILRFFADQRYTVFPLGTHASGQPPRRMREGDALVKNTANFVAVPSEREAGLSMDMSG